MSTIGTIGYVKSNGETAITTVQSATTLDQAFGIFLGNVSKAGADHKDEMNRVFESITDYGHVFMVDLSENVDLDSVMNDDLGYGIAIEDGEEREDETHFFKSENELPGGSIQICHDVEHGSISAIYREGSDELELFWVNPSDSNLITKVFTLTDLEAHYDEEII